MDILSFLLLLLIATWLYFAIKHMITNHKSGGCSSCNGDCSKCKSKETIQSQIPQHMQEQTPERDLHQTRQVK